MTQNSGWSKLKQKVGIEAYPEPTLYQRWAPSFMNSYKPPTTISEDVANAAYSGLTSDEVKSGIQAATAGAGVLLTTWLANKIYGKKPKKLSRSEREDIEQRAAVMAAHAAAELNNQHAQPDTYQRYELNKPRPVNSMLYGGELMTHVQSLPKYPMSPLEYELIAMGRHGPQFVQL